MANSRAVLLLCAAMALAASAPCRGAVVAASAPNVVQVVTTPADGIRSPMTFAMAMTRDAGAYEKRLTEIRALDGKELFAAGAALRAAEKFSAVFSALSERGYEVRHRMPVTAAHWFSALEDTRTAAIFHEGHAAIFTPQGGAEPAVRLMLSRDQDDLEGSVPLSGAAIWRFEQAQGREVRPSPNLKLIFTGGCRAAHAEAYYKEQLRLPDSVVWLASRDSVTARVLVDRLGAGGESARIFELLPAIEAARDRASRFFDSR